MPLYSYINDETGEVVELLQTMGEPHQYVFAGVAWRRLFTPPQLAMDTKIDPWNARQFLDKTSKGGSIGELWDRSAELKEIREEKTGQPDQIVANFEKEKGRKVAKKREKEVKIEIG